MSIAQQTAVGSNLRRLTLTARLIVAVLIVVAVTGTFFDTASRGAVNPFNFFGYFTIQSNLFYAASLVAVVVIEARRERVGDLMLVVRASMTTYLVIVGSVYASLLAPLGVGSIAPEWANVVLHMVTPIFAVLDWLAAADRRPIPFNRLWLLLIYPFVWIIVVIIRGATDGWVPYPFLDPTAGYAVLAMYVVAILVAMLAVGSLVIWASWRRVWRSADVERVVNLEFPYRLALTSADAAWESESIEATDRMPEDGPYRGFVRLTDPSGLRYAYFGGRSQWREEGGARATEGLLFEVSGSLKAQQPKSYPSNGRRFRELSEAIITDSPQLLSRLRKAYRP